MMDGIEIGTAWKQSLLKLKENEVLIHEATKENRWFTPAMIHQSIESLLPWMEPNVLAQFIGKYSLPTQQKEVGIIMAGNIPLVGLQDLFICQLAGHRSIVGLSSRDALLLPFLVNQLPEILQHPIRFRPHLEGELPNMLIATGSDLTARFIDFHFRGIPSLIRSNRFSVAVLDGKESMEDLRNLAKDILMYNGMGCRSVSNVIALPGAKPESLVQALEEADPNWMSNAFREAVRWETAESILLGRPYWQCESIHFVKVDNIRPARVGCLHWVEVGSEAEISAILKEARDKIQVICGTQNEIHFGRCQSPTLEDFPDGIDVMAWLCTDGHSSND